MWVEATSSTLGVSLKFIYLLIYYWCVCKVTQDMCVQKSLYMRLLVLSFHHGFQELIRRGSGNIVNLRLNLR